MTDGVAGWNDLVRSDGARVEVQEGGTIIVRAPPGQSFPIGGGRMNVCPCCNKAFLSARAAKLACDAYLPPEGAPVPQAVMDAAWEKLMKDAGVRKWADPKE